MSVQRLHAFEKTSIQARHTLKRLEVLIDSPRSTDEERTIAGELYKYFTLIRNNIPAQYQDVDLKDRE
jgi:hypothetical protein